MKHSEPNSNLFREETVCRKCGEEIAQFSDKVWRTKTSSAQCMKNYGFAHEPLENAARVPDTPVLEGEYMDHPEDIKVAPIAGTAYRSNFTYDELARLHYGRMRLGNVAAYLYRKYKRAEQPDENVWRAYDIILALLAKVDGRIRTMERIIVDAPIFTIPSPHTSLMTSRNEDYES